MEFENETSMDSCDIYYNKICTLKSEFDLFGCYTQFCVECNIFLINMHVYVYRFNIEPDCWKRLRLRKYIKLQTVHAIIPVIFNTVTEG